ncbi:MAG: hypothetical protein QOC62_4498 [Mycobacterium sp.]|jgi:hypothetical protein|nr:hypothetical protein [Mycobacterium sp.]
MRKTIIAAVAAAIMLAPVTVLATPVAHADPNIDACKTTGANDQSLIQNCIDQVKAAEQSQEQGWKNCMSQMKGSSYNGASLDPEKYCGTDPGYGGLFN